MSIPGNRIGKAKEAKNKGSRTKGSGGLFQRMVNGKAVWVAQVELPRDPVTGKRRRKTLYGDNKTELQKQLNTLLNGVQTGTFAEPIRMPLRDFLNTWLDTHCRPNLKPKTVQDYEDTIKRYIAPHLGHVELGKLQPLHVASFYAARQAEGLSLESVRHIHRILRAALGKAVSWKILKENVTKDAQPRKEDRQELPALTVDQLEAFLEVAETHRLYAFFLMGLTTGMRPGELLGLRWHDVDLDDSAVHVRQAQTWLDGESHPLYLTPKSRAGQRSIPLPDETVQALREHQANQNAERSTAGEKYTDHELVFCTRTGTPLRQSNMRATFRRLAKKANLPQDAGLTIYSLRRTFATLMVHAGVDIKTLQGNMGHTSTDLLLNLYAKQMTDAKREPAKKFNELLRPSSRRKKAATSNPSK